MHYRVSRIPKGNGKFREIYIPSHEYKELLRSFLPQLELILAKFDIHKANYAFQKGRNCALNALQHVGYRYTLTLDIADFFDNVTPKHVAGIVPKKIQDYCFIKGHPRQGLPTSPLIATIAFFRCDYEIIAALKKISSRFSYSRYADDLAISFDETNDAGKVSFVVGQILKRHGFSLNQKKTKLQDSLNGRVVITGIAITAGGLAPTRRTMKKLRAAVHQENELSAQGLLEWSKCKLPNKFYE